MRKRNAVNDSCLTCVRCGNKNTIFRNAGYKKSDGHIKDIWCFKCKDKTPHEEQKNDYGLWSEQ
ncbi:hypothetical protein P4645_15340 [Lysinibacillus fusiformis]|uniref:hypothetical protein n=1 Tax=Lysinibacillus fusiformis TaxID=28031 RepID=UPI002E1DE35C|nr:hypothetical protein [Lysinibacillus fusiformis]